MGVETDEEEEEAAVSSCADLLAVQEALVLDACTLYPLAVRLHPDLFRRVDGEDEDPGHGDEADGDGEMGGGPPVVQVLHDLNEHEILKADVENLRNHKE